MQRCFVIEGGESYIEPSSRGNDLRQSHLFITESQLQASDAIIVFFPSFLF